MRPLLKRKPVPVRGFYIFTWHVSEMFCFVNVKYKFVFRVVSQEDDVSGRQERRVEKKKKPFLNAFMSFAVNHLEPRFIVHQQETQLERQRRKPPLTPSTSLSSFDNPRQRNF